MDPFKGHFVPVFFPTAHPPCSTVLALGAPTSSACPRGRQRSLPKARARGTVWALFMCSAVSYELRAEGRDTAKRKSELERDGHITKTRLRTVG